MSRQSSLAALLIVVTVAVFGQVYDFAFVWDDYVNLVQNPYMVKASGSDLARFWSKPFADLYVPLTYTVWLILTRTVTLWSLLDGSAAQLWPGPFHAANLLLHILAVLVVFAILKKLVRRDWPAAAGALLFAVHPVQVEPVAWVTGLKDVLAGLLSLVSVWQYLAYAEIAAAAGKSASDNSKKKESEDSEDSLTKRKRLHYGLATAAFALALLAKPTAAVVPAALWVLDYYLIGRSMRAATRSLAGWILLVLPIAVVAKMAQTAELVEYITPLWFRPLLFADALGFYLFKLVFPVRLAIDYGRSAQWVVKEGWLDFFWLIPCVAAILLWFGRQRRPWLIAAAALFVIGILPVSGLSVFAFQSISVVADRYLYFSMLGPALALASILSEPRGKPTLVAALTVAMLGLLAIKSAVQVQFWRDENTLFAHALELNPKSWASRNHLGYDLARRGQYEEALEQFNEALREKPQFVDAMVNVGRILALQGKLDEATTRFEEALRIHPGSVLAQFDLANVHAARGEFDEAIRHYREAIRLDPEYFPAHRELGNLLFDRGRIDESIAPLKEALRGNAVSLDVYNNLAIALAKTGQIDEAIGLLRAALRADPKDPETHNNLGIILAGTGQVEDGAEQFREAVRLRPDFAQAHENLSRALGLLGKAEEARYHHLEAQRFEAAKRPRGSER
jgi:tetratricopeptide (TPR) repeat protein